MSLQYIELRPTSGWDLFASLGHSHKFQRVSHLGSVTARHSSSGREPNFAALNRGRHLYSAGRPSRWALAHSLVDLVSVEEHERWGFSFLVCLDRLLVSMSPHWSGMSHHLQSHDLLTVKLPWWPMMVFLARLNRARVVTYSKVVEMLPTLHGRGVMHCAVTRWAVSIDDLECLLCYTSVYSDRGKTTWQ